jgi:hypothetical protein
MAKTVLFSRYRLIEAVGTGGSAEVWRALDTRTGDEVAVKRLHPIVVADEAGRARLRREFEALKALDEPHIVRVRDLHVGKREAALVLDYVPGPSLAQRLAGQAEGRPALAPEEAVGIIGDVAAALSAAHAAGIVHRDVTPGNILLAPDGEARLTDFGIAHGDTDTTAVTATGQVMGTMRYLAPEQLRGAPSTPASDLHSLAAVAYELLAGRHAYDVTTPVALAEAQAAGPPTIAGVAPAVDAVVRGGLATDPSDRPASVAEFASALEAAVAAEPTVAISLEPTRDETAQVPVAAAAVGAAGIGLATGADAAMASGVGPATASTPAGGPGLPEPDDVATASPSRAAAARGPIPHAAGLSDRPPSRLMSRRVAGVPAPLVGLLALLLALGVLGAATSTDRGSADGSPAPLPTARPSPSLKPTPTPSATPTKPPKGHGHGKDKGGGGD